MINITFEPKTLELRVEGHAEHGKKGEDIVCSAISTLFYTLATTLNESEEMLKDAPTISDEGGNGYIKCTPKEEYEKNITLMYYTILTGLDMVASTYPKNVSFTVS